MFASLAGRFTSSVAAASSTQVGYGSGQSNSRVLSGYYSMGKYDSMYGKRRHLQRGYYNKMLSRSRGRTRRAGYGGTRRRGPVVAQYILQRTGGGELKFRAQTQTAAIVGNASVPPDVFVADANMKQMMDIPSGTSDQQRIGQAIWVKSIALRWTINHPTSPTSASISHPVRVVLVYDRSCNKSAATFADVFDGSTANNAWLFKNIEQGKRFVILMDKFVEMNVVAGGQEGTTATWVFPVKNFSYYWKSGKGRGMPIHYTGTSGVIGERTRGNFMLFLATNSNNISMSKVTARIRFTDN